MSNVVDLKKLFDLDNRARGFTDAIRALYHMLDPLVTVLSALNASDQRILLQIASWRMMGGAGLPATQGLVHMPLLVGMSFDLIQERCELMADAGIIEPVTTSQDKKGNVLSMMFTWPQFETLLAGGAQAAKGPRIAGLDGLDLKPE